MHASDVFASPWETLFDDANRQAPSRTLPLWSGLRLEIQALRSCHVAQPIPPQKWQAQTGSTYKPLKDAQTEMIRDAVTQARGNVAEAARALGISRATVYRKLGTPKA